MLNLKKNKEDFVLVRVCIGCVLPYNAKLIGKGTYNIINNKGKTLEQYYDYEIKQKDLKYFLNINTKLLIKYQLLDIETEDKIEDKNPVKESSIRGWSRKDYE